MHSICIAEGAALESASMKPRKRIPLSLSRVRSAITNGRHVLADVDHRSAAMRRLRDLIQLHTTDLGGDDLISEAERRLIRRAAMLTLQLELLDQKFATDGEAGRADLELYQRVSNTLRRLLEALGLQRRPRDVTPTLDQDLGEQVTSERRREARQMKRVLRKTRPEAALSILDAMADPNLFGLHFKDAKTWSAWRAFLAVLFGLPLTADQLQLFRECTGRTTPSPDGHREAWLVIGSRGGKSFVLALIAVWLACFRDYRRYLGPGERATVMVIAADRRQARVIMRYVKGLLQSVPMLSRLIEGERVEAVDLTNRVTIEVHTASFRTTRGYSIAAALCDELAFWQNDEGSSEPDFEVSDCASPWHGDDPRLDVALRVVALLPQRRIVGCIPQAPRARKAIRSSSGKRRRGR